MLVSEKIQRYAERLPERMQIEALDFIEYLVNRWKQDRKRKTTRIGTTCRCK